MYFNFYKKLDPLLHSTTRWAAIAAIFLFAGCASPPPHTGHKRYGRPPYDETDEFYRREQEWIANEGDPGESPYPYPYGPPPQQAPGQYTEQLPDQPQNEPQDQDPDPNQDGEPNPTPYPSHRPMGDYPQGALPGANDIPTAKPGKNGVVESPYVPGKNVDIQGYPPGATVKDPYTNKLFIVPTAPANP